MRELTRIECDVAGGTSCYDAAFLQKIRDKAHTDGEITALFATAATATLAVSTGATLGFVVVPLFASLGYLFGNMQSGAWKQIV